MRSVLASVALLMIAHPVAAQDVTIDWSRTVVTGGVVSPSEGPGGAPVLELRVPGSGPTSFHLVTIDHPPIAGPAYAVAGQVRYQGVEGQGYIEMWTVFPDGQRFFSRTVALQGPLAVLHGDSPWRPFQLPFNLSGGSQLPSRLQVHLVLLGRGTVWLGPVHLGPWSAPAPTVRGSRSSGPFGVRAVRVLARFVG